MDPPPTLFGVHPSTLHTQTEGKAKLTLPSPSPTNQSIQVPVLVSVFPAPDLTKLASTYLDNLTNTNDIRLTSSSKPAESFQDNDDLKALVSELGVGVADQTDLEKDIMTKVSQPSQKSNLSTICNHFLFFPFFLISGVIRCDPNEIIVAEVLIQMVNFHSHIIR